MNEPIADKLDKVLALADSNHDGEAIVAVRKARQMLSQTGMNFSDLARAAAPTPRTTVTRSIFGQSRPSDEALLRNLQHQISTLESELTNQTTLAEFWRRRAVELEQNLNHSQAETIRWREFAHQTVDKLWDLGRAVGDDTPMPEDVADPRKMA